VALPGSPIVLSVSNADPEDVRFREADESAVLEAFAPDPVCRFAVALARVVASILLTVPFAFVT